MPEPQKCRGCGAEIPANAPSGHCAKCLLGLAFTPAAEAPDALAKPAAFSGRTFGDYELQEQIGRGGMGVVYRARQISLNRVVALKLISAGAFASPVLIERFHLEAEAAASLHHPNIVPIYETGEFDGHHYFSMELIEGRGLNKHVRKTGYARGGDAAGSQGLTRERQTDIARIVVKVARAVDYAHRHGVLHRDLKPSNIILDAQGEPHLTDFGVAKVVGKSGSGLTESGAILGTLSFMAPEQASGQSKRVTTAADIYSLGAVLYQMLTGRPPFRADTPIETLRKVVEEEPRHPTTLVETVDRDLATICMKCLDKEPSRRYGSALALAEDVERWLRREPILGRPVGRLGKICRWCQREPVLATMAGAAMLLALAFMVSLLFLVKNEKARAENEKARADLAEILQKQAETDKQRSQWANQIMADFLNDAWEKTTNTSFRIPSVRGARPSGLPAAPKNAQRLTFGIYTHTRPARMYERLADVLTYLETNLSELPLPLDQVIYSGYSHAVDALVNGEVDFMRLGGASYLLARKKQPGIRVLAKQVHDGKPENYGAIFTRVDSGITGPEDLKGRSFAFADPDSTFGTFLAKLKLLNEGIHSNDLSRSEHLRSHDEVVAAVLRGDFDAGAANYNVLRRAMASNTNLAILYPLMHSVTFPWVASTSAPPEVVEQVRQSLLSLKDPTILTNIDLDLTGFMPARPEDYDDLERRIERSKQFDEP